MSASLLVTSWERSSAHAAGLIVPRRPRLSGEETEKPIRHLFLSIGADPARGWLHGCVSLDAKGFVQTGARVPPEVRSGERAGHSLVSGSFQFSYSPASVNGSPPFMLIR
jgi:hypothetical protein